MPTVPLDHEQAAEVIDAMRLRAAQLRTLQLADDCKYRFGSGTMTAEAARAFGALVGELRAIEKLDLAATSLDDRGAYALARLQAETLVDLDISRTKITLDGLRAILANPRLHHLRRLDLGGITLGEEGAALLAATPFTQLETLNLMNCGVDAEPFRAKYKTVVGDEIWAPVEGYDD
ncbi:MAG TPA: hypothetical protein VMZ53_19965 [Kofleriaceae bacterium]|nr:hypothetical protein [Kofleriaceae bacterium]